MIAIHQQLSTLTLPISSSFASPYSPGALSPSTNLFGFYNIFESNEYEGYDTESYETENHNSADAEHNSTSVTEMQPVDITEITFCRAIHDFTGSPSDSTASFKRGDVFEIVVKEPSGWWFTFSKGQSNDQLGGWIPANFVVEISEQEAWQTLMNQWVGFAPFFFEIAKNIGTD